MAWTKAYYIGRPQQTADYDWTKLFTLIPLLKIFNKEIENMRKGHQGLIWHLTLAVAICLAVNTLAALNYSGFKEIVCEIKTKAEGFRIIIPWNNWKHAIIMPIIITQTWSWMETGKGRFFCPSNQPTPLVCIPACNNSSCSGTVSGRLSAFLNMLLDVTLITFSNEIYVVWYSYSYSYSGCSRAGSSATTLWIRKCLRRLDDTANGEWNGLTLVGRVVWV